ncbi:hypothetical protein P3S67_008500 [Capsicum chacoense]
MIKMDDAIKTKGEAELADMLQKSLKRKRYLIVLDDIWSCEVWDGMWRCFPTEDSAGSRILLTTHNNEVARDVGIENLSKQMNFMDQDESWNLFKSAAFSNEVLSSEFETIGKKIAEKCHGLPLTIVVVAGLLKSKRAIEDWESVAKDVKSFVTNDPDERCSRVLGLSYDHLTSDLKTCLVHFGIFPEDSDIPVKRLVRSWMAEGFLKLENDLEGEAEKCLQELVDRCLVLVCKKSLDGTKIRSCKVHDLIYDLCLREIQRENIFIMNDIVLEFDSGWTYLSMRKMKPFKRVIGDEIDYCRSGLYRALLTPVHRQLRDHDNNDLFNRTRLIFSSYPCTSHLFRKSEIIHFKLLKVLELRNIDVDHFPVQILSLIWLRYLSLQCGKKVGIPPEICRLWNLQTFIVKAPSLWKITLPEEIWGLMQLRGVYLRIQNVKELGLSAYQIDSKIIRDFGLLNNLVHLQQLETLSFIYCYDHFGGFLPASAKAFPATLKKLKLESTYLSLSYLDIIAELPNLEVLKLMYRACDGEEWRPTVMGFNRLKLLLIEQNDLKYWKATHDNFPVLERLMLRCCYYLDKIPIKFAEIHTLQLIDLTSCLPELGESAAQIQKEHEDIGNNPVDVRISDPFWGRVFTIQMNISKGVQGQKD